MFHSLNIFRISYIFSYLLLCFALIFIFTLQISLANKISDMRFSVKDIEAGSNFILSVDRLLPDKKIYVYLDKPDGSTITFLGLSNEFGNFSLNIPDYHTRATGKYCFNGIYAGLDYSSSKSCFNVFPSLVSAEKSFLSYSQLAYVEQKNVTVKVFLRDIFGNSVVGKKVMIVSDNSDYFANSQILRSGMDGSVSFYISSDKPGKASFSFILPDDSVVIKDRATILFENKLVASAFRTVHAQSVGPLYGFDIYGLPEKIFVGDKVSFNVKAVDTSSNTVENYTGTIRFSIDGPNSDSVTLPLDFKFEAQNLGDHRFDLALSFVEAGVYTLIVSDTADRFKKGEIIFDVSSRDIAGASTSISDNDSSSSVDVRILSPTAGTYSQSTQIVSGTANTGSTVNIYSNDRVIGSTVAGFGGRFSFTTSTLSDGRHEIFVEAIDAITKRKLGVSDKVIIFIDSVPPPLEDIFVNPSNNIKAGDTVTVTLYSEKNLSQAIVTYGTNIAELKSSLDDPTKYEGLINVPDEGGIYPMDIILIDELGNEITYENRFSLNVDSSGNGTISSIIDLDEKEQSSADLNSDSETDSNIVKLSPPQVKGLKAYGSDNRVTLNWTAVKHDVLIANYMVYFGDNIDNMDTAISTFDASPAWYVPNLQNGKEYFFSVSAVDIDGNESVLKSNIVSAIPFVIELNEQGIGSPDFSLEDRLPDLRLAAFESQYLVDVKEIDKTGPHLIIPLIFSLIFGGLFFKFRFY